VGALLIQRDGPVYEFTLNRPRTHNALDSGLLAELGRELVRVQEEGARAVVLHGGESRSFCAGADLNELSHLDATEAWHFNLLGQATMQNVERSAVPVIAAVHGYALGGGLELALSCTFVLAATDAQLGLPEATLGLMPGYGGTQRLTAAIGRGPALRLMMTGERLNAAEAARLGLLSEPAVPREALLTRARQLAHSIAEASTLSIELITAAVGPSRADDTALDHETALAAIAISSVEAKARIEQFLTKRSRGRAPEDGSGAGRD
jgi:enoyl-CoA hydratase